MEVITLTLSIATLVSALVIVVLSALRTRRDREVLDEVRHLAMQRERMAERLSERDSVEGRIGQPGRDPRLEQLALEKNLEDIGALFSRFTDKDRVRLLQMYLVDEGGIRYQKHTQFQKQRLISESNFLTADWEGFPYRVRKDRTASKVIGYIPREWDEKVVDVEPDRIMKAPKAIQ